MIANAISLSTRWGLPAQPSDLAPTEIQGSFDEVADEFAELFLPCEIRTWLTSVFDAPLSAEQQEIFIERVVSYLGEDGYSPCSSDDIDLDGGSKLAFAVVEGGDGLIIGFWENPQTLLIGGLCTWDVQGAGIAGASTSHWHPGSVTSGEYSNAFLILSESIGLSVKGQDEDDMLIRVEELDATTPRKIARILTVAVDDWDDLTGNGIDLMAAHLLGFGGGDVGLVGGENSGYEITSLEVSADDAVIEELHKMHPVPSPSEAADWLELAQELCEQYDESNELVENLTKIAQGGNPDYRVRKTVVEHQTLTPELTQQLANDPDPHVRQGAAKHQTLTPELTQQLANDPEDLVRWAVAFRTDLPPELIQQLANDPENWVRGAVVEHQTLTPELTQQLANDPDPDVRQGVAKHQTLTPELALQLANDADLDVRYAMAERMDLPPELAQQLANDPDSDVRQGVAYRTDLPPELIQQLADDPEWGVRQGVAKHQTLTPELALQLANDSHPYVRRAVAYWTDLPPELIRQLANDPDPGVRQGVAEHQTLTPELIQRLANDPDQYVRGAVAEHQMLTPDLAQQLANDPKLDVRRAIAERRQPSP